MRRWPWSTSDPVDNTWHAAVLTAGTKVRQAQNRDFCLRHLHSTLPLGGSQSEYCYAVWHGKTRMIDGSTRQLKILMICLFVLTQFTKHRHTDGRTLHDDIGRACIASRGKNKLNCWAEFVQNSQKWRAEFANHARRICNFWRRILTSLSYPHHLSFSVPNIFRRGHPTPQWHRMQVVMKNRDFRPESRFISEMMQVRTIVFYGRRILNRTQTFEWCHFQWCWVTLDIDFKVTMLFNVK